MVDQVKFGATGFEIGPDGHRWMKAKEYVASQEARGLPVSTSMGNRAEYLYMRGAVHEDQLSTIMAEWERNDQILLVGDFMVKRFPSGKIFVIPVSYTPEKPSGTGISPWHRFEMIVEIKGDSAKYKRCSNVSSTVFANTFSLSGTNIVDLPVGAYNTNQAISYNRTCADGLIPIVSSPSIPVITYDVPESDLTKGNVIAYRNGMEKGLKNGLIDICTRNDEASNAGRLDFKHYGNGAWVTAGTISLGVKSSSGTLEYFDGLPPTSDFAWRGEDKEVETMRLDWGSSAANTYKIFSHLTLQRGTPYALLTINNKGKDLVEARCKINMALTTMRYYNTQSELDATAVVDGTEMAPALQAANWTVGAGWAAPAGTLNKNADGVGTAAPTTPLTIVAGVTYKVVITLSALSVGTCAYTLGGVTGSSLAAATTYTDTIVATTTGNLIFTPTNTSRFTISAVSVKAMTQDGSTDTNPCAFLNDAAVGATTTEVGFWRAKKANVKWIATDAGNYWSDIAIRLHTLDIKRSKPFPNIWIFSQYQGNTGAAPTTLDDEGIMDLSVNQSIVQVI